MQPYKTSSDARDSMGSNGFAAQLRICMLGDFRLFKDGLPIPLQQYGKAEVFLCNLALQRGRRITRDVLLDTIWPQINYGQARRSLNTLVYQLKKILGDSGAAPQPLIVYEGGYYRLNLEAGIEIDLIAFETFATASDQQHQMGHRSLSAEIAQRAIDLYRGDLCYTASVASMVERERLCAQYICLLERLALWHFDAGAYHRSLDGVMRLLVKEPCHESGHRLAMRCYLRLGRRSQALRQYRLCEAFLRTEFNTGPEKETTALFNQIRLDPTGI